MKKSHQIALGGVATAFCVICLVLAEYFSIITGGMIVLATFALMIPLSKKLYLVTFLCYLASSVLSVVFGGFVLFYRIFLFLAFMGLHPLVNEIMQLKNFNKYIGLAIKTVWFDLVLYIFYLLFVHFALGGDITANELLSNVNPYLWAVIIFGGSIFFVVYDFVIKRCQFFINLQIERITKNN